LLTNKECQKLAITGLGGVGKTQVALEFAYLVKEARQDYSIFWMPALSLESFEQACGEIAKLLGITQAAEEDVKELVKRQLSSERADRWLLIVDNADDMEIMTGSEQVRGIADYLPHSEDGLVVFTTRTQKAAVALAGKDVIELEAMTGEEATGLFKSLIRIDLLGDGSNTTDLLEELAYLPLAIAQAAAYLNTTRISVGEYLRLLRNTEQDMVSLLSREFYDGMRYRGSKNAIATTWLVSFNQILKHDHTAAELLSFMSCIEPTSIPRSILPTADSEEQMVHAIGMLCAYALVVRRANEEIYDLHRLVHMATRVWLGEYGPVAEKTEQAIRHVAEIFPPDDWENRALWRVYLPHALRLLEGKGGKEMVERCDLCFWVGRCLMVDGRVREAVRWLEECTQGRRSILDADDAEIRVSQHELAHAYRYDRQVGKAVELLEHVVAVEEMALSEEHPDRLASQHELAGAYRQDGQVGKAVELLEHVVVVREKVLSEEHPDLLASQHQLARAYRQDGQVGKSVELLEHVVAFQAKVLAEEHPDRLVPQHMLALAYKEDGQVGKAVELLEHVVAVQEKVLAEEHPDRLASQHELAIVYQEDGQVDRAVELLEHVVAVEARVLRDGHPSRLASQNSLAAIYAKLSSS
jgi:tetratricopeptide (TPR) repeat protein